jgi:16S rRNA (cytosine1402-N4)-methyltransferase
LTLSTKADQLTDPKIGSYDTYYIIFSSVGCILKVWTTMTIPTGAKDSRFAIALLMAAGALSAASANAMAPSSSLCFVPASNRARASAPARPQHRHQHPLAMSLDEDNLWTETDTDTETEQKPPRARRERYDGRYPRNFSDKYKEHGGDADTIAKVLAKGMTPAGTHVPILLQECLHHLGLSNQQDDAESLESQSQPSLVVDCTLGYGGHSSQILKALSDAEKGSSLVAFDQDSIEIAKTEERLRAVLKELTNEDGAAILPANNEKDEILFTAVNQNFATLASYLRETDQMGKVTSLLADLGLSSMQIDDNARGFTYKREGPLDMRMNTEDSSTETAYDLLRRLKPKQLQAMLAENSDEVYASEIASALLGKKGGANIPETTVELAARVRDTVRPFLQDKKQQPKKLSSGAVKKLLDSTVARVMQAIRIEINGEFRVLDQLLEDLPDMLVPNGRAVFLTFHSGEDRRVKKAFKAGFKNGIYSSWSSDVVRPSSTERRENPRSSCCKLRWAIRSDSKDAIVSDV